MFPQIVSEITLKYLQLRPGNRPFPVAKMRKNVESIPLKKINQSVRLRLDWKWKDKKKNTREEAIDTIKAIDAKGNKRSN